MPRLIEDAPPIVDVWKPPTSTTTTSNGSSMVDGAPQTIAGNNVNNNNNNTTNVNNNINNVIVTKPIDIPVGGGKAGDHHQHDSGIDVGSDPPTSAMSSLRSGGGG